MQRGTHILLADDEKDFRFSASIALRKAGYRVTVAMNGREAIARIMEARATGDPVHVLVTDQQMPGMTGTQLASVLRAREIEVPVILVTAYRDASIGNGLRQGIISEFIEKPIAPHELVACLKRVKETAAGKSA